MKRNTKKIIVSAVRLLLLAVISLFLGVRLYHWNAETFVGNAMPMPFGWGLSVVLSGSMEPALHVNDLVIVRQQDSYAVGDIIVFQEGRRLVIHRVISVNGEQLTTQGDANQVSDAPIMLSAVKGKSAAVIPYIGGILRFLKTPFGCILMLIGAVILFEVPYYRRRRKARTDREALLREIETLRSDNP